MQTYLDEGLTVLHGRGTTLACICRGTDYNNTLVGISRQPTPEMVIEKAHEFIKLYNIDSVYCATEDAAIYAKFEKEFGARLIPNIQRKYNGNDGMLLAQYNVKHNIDATTVAREYFRSIYIVSQCDYFIGGAVSSTGAVMLMPNNFKETYVFRLGSMTADDVAHGRAASLT